MLSYILALLGLPLLCVLWIVFQQWLAKNSPGYHGYKAGCGGCSRSCGDSQNDGGQAQAKTDKTVYIEATSLQVKHNE